MTTNGTADAHHPFIQRLPSPMNDVSTARVRGDNESIATSTRLRGSTLLMSIVGCFQWLCNANGSISK